MPDKMPAKAEELADIDIVRLIEILQGLVSRTRTLQATVQSQGDISVARISAAGEAAASAVRNARPRSTRRDGYNPSGRARPEIA